MSGISYGLEYKPKGKVHVTESEGTVLVQHVFDVVDTTVDLGTVIHEPIEESKGVLAYEETRVGHDFEEEEVRYDAPEDVFEFLREAGFTLRER